MPNVANVPGEPTADADAVLLASRALVGVAARSLAQVENLVSAMQWRVLVVVAGRPQLSLQEMATRLDVHPSTGTRLCDQLVAKGLIARQEHPVDRRFLVLSLTPQGQLLVSKVTDDRRRSIEAILAGMPEATRRRLVRALRDFAAAAGEIVVDPLWDLVVSSSDVSS